MTFRLSTSQSVSNRLRHVLLSSAVVAIAAVPAATYAQAGPSAQQARAGEIQFDVPPQALDSALTAVADQGGIHIFFTSGDMAGLRSNGVSGHMTVEQALSQVLTGSAFGWRYREARTVVIEKLPETSGAIQLGPVRVEGEAGTRGYPAPPQAMIGNPPPVYAGGQVARGGRVGLLGNRDVMDTPFNVTNFTSETISNQQPRTLADFLSRNDPSVRAIGGEGDSTDGVFIRGFRLYIGEASLNGLPGLAAQYRSSTEYIERVELLKGPGALLSGIAPSGGVGGGINLVTKRAGNDPLTRVSASYLSDSRIGLSTDIGRRFGPGDEFGIRVNGAWRNGGTARDNQHENFGLASIGLDYRGERLRIGFDAIWQQSRQRGARGALGFPSVLKVAELPLVPGVWNYDQPWTTANNRDVTTIGRVEYDITANITAFAGVGHLNSSYKGLAGNANMLNEMGDYSLDLFLFNFAPKTTSADAGVRARFSTGDIDHNVTLSANGFWQTSYLAFDFSPGSLLSNIYSPVVYPRPNPFPNVPSKAKSAETRLPSVAIADTISTSDERLQLTLGVRHQTVKTKSFNRANGAVTSIYDQSAVTPMAAILFKPAEGWSVYGNYIQGLSQGVTAPVGATNAGEVFPPFKTEQVEVGVKRDWGMVITTLSLFNITKPSGILNDEGAYEIIGEQRNRGIEFHFFGALIPTVRILGGLSYTDAKILRGSTASVSGKRAGAVPKFMGNLTAEWDASPLPGVTLTASAIQTGSVFVDAANSTKAPSWTRFDFGGRWTTDVAGKPLTFRLNIENAFNKRYWSVPDFEGIQQAMPRTAILSVTADF